MSLNRFSLHSTLGTLGNGWCISCTFNKVYIDLKRFLVRIFISIFAFIHLFIRAMQKIFGFQHLSDQNEICICISYICIFVFAFLAFKYLYQQSDSILACNWKRSFSLAIALLHGACDWNETLCKCFNQKHPQASCICILLIS